MEERLPFGLLGFDSNNGGEFLNHPLWSNMRDRPVAVEFTRSRPYHSDDNAQVEQKNWTWARQLLGYGRVEDPELVGPIRALYREVWARWQNFFLPCLKLERQWRESSHWHKRYEFPQTAYERLCGPGMLTPKERRSLRERYESLDPFNLKEELEKKLKQISCPKSGGSPSPRKPGWGFRPPGGRAMARRLAPLLVLTCNRTPKIISRPRD
jgi:hypothetical protein